MAKDDKHRCQSFADQRVLIELRSVRSFVNTEAGRHLAPSAAVVSVLSVISDYIDRRIAALEDKL